MKHERSSSCDWESVPVSPVRRRDDCVRPAALAAEARSAAGRAKANGGVCSLGAAADHAPNGVTSGAVTTGAAFRSSGRDVCAVRCAMLASVARGQVSAVAVVIRPGAQGVCDLCLEVLHSTGVPLSAVAIHCAADLPL